MLLCVLAHANVPAVIFSDVKSECVGPDHDADSHVTIAQQHSFEKIRCRGIAAHRVRARNGEAAELSRVQARTMGGSGKFPAGGRSRQSGRLQKLSASRLHETPPSSGSGMC